MSDIKVYGVPGSPYMRSVLIALEEKSQPYRIEALTPGASASAAYRALNPFGRIPTFEHGDYRLYETQAILRYIDAAFPSPPLQPKAPEEIGRMNQVIGINDCYLFPDVSRIIAFQRIVGPALFGSTPDEQAIAAAIPDAQRCLGELNRLLGAHSYFAGDFSLADVHLAPQLDYLAMTPEVASILKGTPLSNWLGRVLARPSLQRTLPPEPLRKAV